MRFGSYHFEFIKKGKPMSREKVSKRQERRERMQRQQQRQRLIIIGAITLVAALLVFLVVWKPLSTVGEIVTVTPAALPNADGLSLGDPNAPATIDVFEDFQCPACKSFTESIEPLVIENLVATGKARYVFHNYSFLDGDGAGSSGESDQAANASMCANEQDKFWEMHSALYANWNGENQGGFNNRRLQAIAESVGLDMDAFNSCFNSNKYESDIQADFDLGQDMGVSGTPSVFVNGQRVGAAGKIATYQDIADAVNAINIPQ
jgi:protein-disulfide isomerase